MSGMKSYASFDLFVKDQSKEQQKIIAALRKLVKRAAPKLTETVKWGNGCFVNEKLPIVYVHAETDHVQFGFFGGSLLKDPEGVLEGSGNYVRHVKIYSEKDINSKILINLLQQAEKNDYKSKN